MQFLTVFLQAQGAQSGDQGYSSLLLMLGVIVILYFFMIRPQMQRQKKEKQFRAQLAKGDNVVTIGGIYGKIVSIDDDSVLLSVDEGTKIRVTRSAISKYKGDTTEGAQLEKK